MLRVMRTAAAALVLILASRAAAEPVPESIEPHLARLREAYRGDRQPPELPQRPSDVPEADWAVLQRLSAQISNVQAGLPASQQHEHDRGYRLASRAVLRSLGSPPGHTSQRMLPSPGALKRYIRSACADGHAAADCRSAPPESRHWCTWRVFHVGPVLDQLRERPEGPVRLPLGHPYHGTLREIACQEPDPLAEKAREIERLREELLDPDADVEDVLRRLSAAYGEALALAHRHEREECAGYTTQACVELRRQIAEFGTRRRMFAMAEDCLRDPSNCGGMACGLSSICAVPRSAAAYAKERSEESLIDFKAELLAAVTLALGPVSIVARYPVKLAAREALLAARASRASNWADIVSAYGLRLDQDGFPTGGSGRTLAFIQKGTRREAERAAQELAGRHGRIERDSAHVAGGCPHIHAYRRVSEARQSSLTPAQRRRLTGFGRTRDRFMKLPIHFCYQDAFGMSSCGCPAPREEGHVERSGD